MTLAIKERVKAALDKLATGSDLDENPHKRATERGKTADGLRAHGVAGVSIAIINDHRIDLTVQYGVIDASAEFRVESSTKFQAGCISKPISAATVLRLAIRGDIDLDENVNRYLKRWKLRAEVADGDSRVTVRQVLGHCAGLTVNGLSSGYSRLEPLPCITDILNGHSPARSGSVQVRYAPESRVEYSNGGYALLQCLIEDTTGRPFGLVAQEEILGPLGMTSSAFATDTEEPFAKGHSNEKTLIDGFYRLYPDLAASGLWTTPTDLANFMISLMRAYNGEASCSSHVITCDLARSMLTPYLEEWGLGLLIRGSGDSSAFQHSGATSGFRSMFFGYSQRGQGAIIMTNSAGKSTILIAAILRILSTEYGWPHFQVKGTTSVDLVRCRSYIGRYGLPGGQVAMITLEEGRLFGAVQGQKYELFPVTPTQFTFGVNGKLVFEANEEGGIEAFVLNNVQRAQRISDATFIEMP